MLNKEIEIDDVYALVYGNGEGNMSHCFGRNIMVFVNENGSLYNLNGEKLYAIVENFVDNNGYGVSATAILGDGTKAKLCKVARYFNGICDLQPCVLPTVLDVCIPVPKTKKSFNEKLLTTLDDLVIYEEIYNEKLKIKFDTYSKKKQKEIIF